MQEEISKYAVDVLDSVFSGIDFENMGNERKMNIWNEFKSKVKGCAMQSISLAKFVESICKKFSIKGFNEYAVFLEAEKHEREILKLYREETFMIIFKLRILRDERKEMMTK